MMLGAESYDYLAVGSFPAFNDNQLAALGYYQIVSGLVASTNTRFAYGKSMKFAGSNNNSAATWLLPNEVQPTTVFVGMACFIDELNENDHPSFCLFQSTANAGAISVTFMPFGSIRVSTGAINADGTPVGGVLFTSPGGIWRLNTWFYIEVSVTVDDDLISPNGTMELRFNTVPIADYINVTTGSPGVSFVDSVQWKLGAFPAGGNKLFYWDDVYVCDDVPSAEGPTNDFFLGNTRVQGLLPAGPGDNTDFDKVGAATNWQAASNVDVDDDAYVWSKDIGDYDLYTIEPIVNTPNVFAVQIKGAYRQDDATQRFAVNTLKSDSTQVDGTPHALNANYSFQWDIFPADPATTMTWAYSDVNTIQIGPKVES